MTWCQQCGSTETDINELDDSTCCIQCGTVLESSFTSFDYTAAYRKDTDKSLYKTEKKSARIRSLCDWYHLAARFFELDYSMIEQGKERIEYYTKALSTRNRYIEIALAMVCVMDKRNWGLNDYMLHFPHPVHRASCIKAYRVFTNNQAVTEVDTVDNVVESFYDVIVMTLFGSPTVPEGLNLVDLKTVVKRLIDLGNMYRVNLGKKARAIVAATCCIAALYLHTRIFTHKKRKSKEKKKKSEFKWSFEIFAKPFSCSITCIRKAYVEYNRLLDECFKKLPWTSQKTEAYYHLDDILHLFGSGHIKLTTDEFVPDIQLKHKESRDRLQQCVAIARNHMQNLTVPSDHLVYSVYQLLVRGHDVAEIVQMQESAIQEMCVTLEFREQHHSALPHSHMDNNQLGSEDLSAEEESYYLVGV